MDRVISEFKVRDHETGAIYDVIELQEYNTYRDVNGNYHELAGMKRLEMADGSGFLNFIDTDTFKIVSTDRIVRKV